MRDRLVSLMYHNVCPTRRVDGTFPDFHNLSPSITTYFVDADTFDRHCGVIAAGGRAIGFDELRHPTPSDPSQPPRVLLTFDDGWRDCVEVGGPILVAHGLHAMLFVTTDLIGHRDFVGLETLRSLPSQFCVGSHAKTHRFLSDLSDADVTLELRESKAVLEDILGHEVNSLAYPGGSFDRRVERIAAEVGYQWIFTSEPSVAQHSKGPLRIGRVPVKADTSTKTIARWVRGDLRREQRRAIALAAAKRLMGRRLYRTLRSCMLSEKAGQLEMTDLTDHEAAGLMKQS